MGHGNRRTEAIMGVLRRSSHRGPGEESLVTESGKAKVPLKLKAFCFLNV